MSFARYLVYSGVSLVALSTSAFAQSTPQTGATRPDTGTAAVSAENPADIVVEARRRSERLEDVPKALTAVTSADLHQNNIQKFEDVATLVPGLDILNSGNAEVEEINIRGTTFNVDSGLSAPTVQLYLNDGNVNPNIIFQSLYDIGQIEVLKGPQGTLRGRSSPSGSITLTTKAPDLYKWGAYAQVTGETLADGLREEYALSAPIIPGVLAVRFAGVHDDNQGDNIKSVSAAPGQASLYPGGDYNRVWSNRVSVRFDPIDSLEFKVMYQRTINHNQGNQQTESTCLIDPREPCGPGPLITVGDRAGTINGQRETSIEADAFTGNIDWHIFGQRLSYVGLYTHQDLHDAEAEDGADYFNNAAATPPSSVNPVSPVGSTNPVSPAPYGIGSLNGVANPYSKLSYSNGYNQSHEIRLASEDRILGIFDYVVGGMMVYQITNNLYTPTLAPLSQQYVNINLPSSNIGPSFYDEWSYFGNITAHPTDKLELSGGARYLIDKVQSLNTTTFQTIYPRTTNWVWSASGSYHFSPDLMVYANAGSAYRPGGLNLGFQFTPFSVGAAYVGPSQFYQISGEKSTSYEVGFKSQLFDRKLTFNLDYFHQNFNGFQYTTTGYVEYLAYAFAGPAAGTFIPVPLISLGTENVPAKIDGVEGDINYAFNREASIGTSFSYIDGRVTGGAVVPCLVPAAQLTPANQVGTCPGGPTSFAPKFEATVHADYARPVNRWATGFVHAQLALHGATPLDSSAPYDKQPFYGILNLYVGLRSPHTAWEAKLFVENVTGNTTRLGAYGGDINANTPGRGSSPAGPVSQYSSYYTYIAEPTPRIFGLELRYAFGSQ